MGVPVGPSVSQSGGVTQQLSTDAGLVERIRQLEEALECRTTIARAQGIIMERYEMDAGRAFDVLRRISNQSNVPVRDIADYLIDTRRLPK